MAGHTVVIVAQRISTAIGADKIVLLDAGRGGGGRHPRRVDGHLRGISRDRRVPARVDRRGHRAAGAPMSEARPASPRDGSSPAGLHHQTALRLALALGVVGLRLDHLWPSSRWCSGRRSTSWRAETRPTSASSPCSSSGWRSGRARSLPGQPAAGDPGPTGDGGPPQRPVRQDADPVAAVLRRRVERRSRCPDHIRCRGGQPVLLRGDLPGDSRRDHRGDDARDHGHPRPGDDGCGAADRAAGHRGDHRSGTSGPGRTSQHSSRASAELNGYVEEAVTARKPSRPSQTEGDGHHSARHVRRRPGWWIAARSSCPI